MNIHEWSIVERFGKEGERYEDVIERVSRESLPLESLQSLRAGVSERMGSSLGSAESLAAQSPQVNVSCETSDYLSALDDRLSKLRIHMVRAFERELLETNRLRFTPRRKNN
jgi:hypothetical protein